jgi:hypothetical protein
VATIDAGSGAIGVALQLDTSPKTASSWTWEVIRRPSGSTALLSSISVRNPTFTPDVADFFVFRLTASDGTKTSITTVSPASGCTIAQPVVTAPALVGEGSPNRTASVSDHALSHYTWTITFRAGLQGTLTLSVVETSAAGCFSSPGNATVNIAPAGSALLFYPVYPCRLFQTGSPVPAPPFTGLDMGAGETRSIAIPAGGACGIPPTARAIALNATVVAPTAQGYLTFWASGTPRPLTSSVNFTPLWLFFDAELTPPRFIWRGGTRSGNTIVSTPTGAGAGFEVLNGSAGAAGLIIDVSGYFE